MFNLVAKQSLNAAKKIAINPAILSRTKVTELKVTWERPEKLPRYGPVRSGDFGVYEQPDQNNICLEYQYATELECAEPNVRNQFTLGWHSLEYSKRFYEKTLIDSVRSHMYDYNSPVTMIAQLTGSIRFMQHSIFNNLVKNSRRKIYKRDTNKLVRARTEMIKSLRETDYKQYEWLLERLDLEYKPKPDDENQIMISRKEGLRQLTKAYCDDVKNKRLDTYRQELEAAQLPFLERKLKNLEFIRNEQLELKINVTITKEQIEEVRQKYETMKKEYDSKKIEPTKKKWKVY